MEHVAIDLGASQSQVCVRAADGTVLEERRCPTAKLAEYLANRPPSRVIMETCTEAFYIAEATLKLGHQVRVVPATLVHSLGVGSRRTKTDRRDAQKLSEVSCRVDLPSVHIPSEQARQRKARLGARDALVQARTLLINHVRGTLRASLLRLGKGSAPTFTKRVRALCVVVERVDLEPSLVCIDALTEQLRLVDRDLSTEAARDPVCRRLMTVPGVGWVTALRFVATLDRIDRFAGAHQVESYLGLVPGEDSSSERQRRTGITKAGSTSMRWTLVQAAWAARRARHKDGLQLWAEQIEQRRGKRVAVTALARKLAGILFAIWRDGTVYQATVEATASAAA